MLMNNDIFLFLPNEIDLFFCFFVFSFYCGIMCNQLLFLLSDENNKIIVGI
jgi:hypothetical protein